MQLLHSYRPLLLIFNHRLPTSWLHHRCCSLFFCNNNNTNTNTNTNNQLLSLCRSALSFARNIQYKHDYSTTGCWLNKQLYLDQHFEQIQQLLYHREIHRQQPSTMRVIFVNYENHFAYRAMCDEPCYKQTVGQVLQRCLPDDHTDDFGSLHKGLFLPLSSKNVDTEVNALLEKVPSMNAFEIAKLQKQLLVLVPFCKDEAEWRNIYLNTHFNKLWKALDATATELLINCDSLQSNSLYEALAISSLWFELGLGKEVQYNRELVMRLCNSQPSHLDASAFIQLMFTVNLHRSMPKKYLDTILSQAHFHMQNSKDKLSFEALSIISMGFFKTQTRMPDKLLLEFVQRCTSLLESACSNEQQSPSTISIASIIKCVRFSLESNLFDARYVRADIQQLVDAITKHKANYLSSNICATHLLLLLNSAFLQRNRKLYKTIFDNMINDLQGFRIKDIERILFCLANVMFTCPNAKFYLLEQHLINSEDIQLYPNHVYNIVYYLITLNYYPHKLIKLSCDKNHLAKSLETKFRLEKTLLLVDTILRLELNNHTLLTREQLNKFSQSERSLFAVKDGKMDRFVNSVQAVLRPIYSDNFRLMYIFPFSHYPLPVILSHKLAAATDADLPTNHCEQPKPGQFSGSIVLMLLLTKDKIFGDRLRGYTSIQKRLLEKLGFRVVLIEQKDYRDFILPYHLNKSDSESYQQTSDKLLQTVSLEVKKNLNRSAHIK